MLDASLTGRSAPLESLELALAAYKARVNSLSLENKQLREMCAVALDPLVAANIDRVLAVIAEHHGQTIAEAAVQYRGVLEVADIAINALAQSTPDPVVKQRLIEIIQPLSLVLKGKS